MQCRVCGEEKPPELFHPSRGKVTTLCRACRNARVRALPSTKNRVRPHDPEKARAKYQKTRVAVLARMKEYARTHVEATRCRAKLWRAENPERARANAKAGKKRRKALLRGADPAIARISAKQWHARLELVGNCCAYCGVTAQVLEMDHIVPVSRGGQHVPENVAPACRSCNARKSDRLLSEWLWL
jgi:5-methylcytosine-specific restriction endonuclease McrA